MVDLKENWVLVWKEIQRHFKERSIGNTTAALLYKISKAATIMEYLLGLYLLNFQAYGILQISWLLTVTIHLKVQMKPPLSIDESDNGDHNE